MFDVKVFRVPMSAPDDVSELKKIIKEGKINPEEIIAIMGKTEGNGCVNDFTRGFCTMAFKILLSRQLGISLTEVGNKVAFVMSGGTEGVMSPHATIFTKSEDSKSVEIDKSNSLSVSVGFTRDFLPEEIGKMIMIKEVENTVKKLVVDAGIDSKEDVHFVQIKCPLLTSDRIREAKSRGKEVVVTNTYKSMGYSRGASALGVALALGEVNEEKLNNHSILKDWSLFSEVASISAGVELLNCEIILMGNSKKSNSEFVIGHAVMKDIIDLQGILQALKNSGLKFNELPNEDEIKRIINVFAKAEADPNGYVRGRRSTMLTDSDINHTRHARAVVNAIIAAVVGDPMVYVSGGAEHQGPTGGGPIACIIKKKSI